MDNRDIRNILGEILCSIIPDSAIKAVIHTDMVYDYKNEFEFVINLYNGKCYASEITMAALNSAKEGYKRFNKLILEMSTLSLEKKKELSLEIDRNAESFQQKWIHNFKNRGIRIL